MPNIFIEHTDMSMPDPSEGAPGEIRLVCGAWHKGGSKVGFITHFNFAETPNQVNTKIRANAIAKLAENGIVVGGGDKVYALFQLGTL
jgi:hypothetical protein